MMLKVLNYILILLIFMMASACNEKQTSITIEENQVVFSDFLDFPEKLFLNIEPDTSLTENYNLIGKHEFARFDNLIQYRPNDSTYILFNEGENVSAFKVYFKSQSYLTQTELFYDFLSQKSEHTIGSHEFSQMDFTGTQTPFKLTFFSTADFIRLSYTIKSTKH